MMTDVPPIYRKRSGRRRRESPPPAPPVGPLTLVAAAYQSGGWVELTFDRAIDIAAIDGAAITVDDGDAVLRFVGTAGATLTAPASVRVDLTGAGEWLDPGVRMTVTAANGIVAVGDGAAWAGVTNVVIPFP